MSSARRGSSRIRTSCADRFSQAAGQYAAWQLEQGYGLRTGPIQAKGRLLSYATMTGPVTTDAALAPSRLFDAYAGFIERRQASTALFGGMLSLTQSEAHSHNEVNAIALGGYGEHLLRNAGYNGYGTGVGSATWTWINSTAESGNTVVINNVDHASKTGGGVTKGFVGGALEFARGDSGSALSNGKHLRDMMFIQPSDGAHGYWLVGDHVTPTTRGLPVQAFWHPNAASLLVQNPGERYLSDTSVGPVNFSSNEVKLTTFLATPPASTQIRRTTLANRSYSFDADYLAATYNSNTGSADMLTAFFPHDPTHAVADLARIATGTFTGSTITQGAVVDTALVSNGSSFGAWGSKSFLGQDVVFRTVGGDLSWFFVGEGRSFNDGTITPTGFQADANVSLFLDGTAGSVISPGTNLTIYEPGIASLLLNNQPATPWAAGAGWLSVFIPAGTHALSIDLLAPTADFDASGVIDGADLLIWQRNLGTVSGATIASGDSDYDGDVDADDLATWRTEVAGLPAAGAAATPIPEPPAIALAGFMLIAACCGLQTHASRTTL